MPRIKTIKTKRPPQGFDLIEPTLREFEERLKKNHDESGDKKRKVETA